MDIASVQASFTLSHFVVTLNQVRSPRYAQSDSAYTPSSYYNINDSPIITQANDWPLQIDANRAWQVRQKLLVTNWQSDKFNFADNIVYAIDNYWHSGKCTGLHCHLCGEDTA